VKELPIVYIIISESTIPHWGLCLTSDDGSGRYLVYVYRVSINLMATTDGNCTMQSRAITRSQHSSPFPNGQLILGEYRISPISVPHGEKSATTTLARFLLQCTQLSFFPLNSAHFHSSNFLLVITPSLPSQDKPSSHKSAIHIYSTFARLTW
jgi:hypothetical protein